MIGDRLSVLLLLLVMSLGALAAWQWQVANGGVTPIAPAASTNAPLALTRAATPRVLAPIEELSQTVERPLFDRTRRPPVVAELASEPTTPPPVASVPPTPLVVELSAVILEDDRRFALFRQASEASLLRAQVGDLVDGWTVSDIRPDGVSLQRGSEQQELLLRTFKAPPPQAAVVRAQQAARAANSAPRAVNPATAARTGTVQRPRRPLRAPRRRSIQRQSPTVVPR